MNLADLDVCANPAIDSEPAWHAVAVQRGLRAMRRARVDMPMTNTGHAICQPCSPLPWPLEG
ncbi:hypothetical protein BER93_13360 [Xanthomonas fragariae]|nr:hypothetical protein BER92_13330 [Xanthomonas fragariae]AOD18925.1 hypothetical protein BER93_13360 [Xanthomonas fragariae]ENZ97153.1 hypothetical protein O1K_00425 [Xanthomonas fragariae LMG 25863]